MNSFGSWFLGLGGTERVAALANRLFNNIKTDNENASGEKYRAYVPWMSMYGARSELQSLYNISPLPDILVVPEILSVLVSAFKSDEGPLGKLGLDEAHSDEIICRPSQLEVTEIVEMMLAARDLFLSSSDVFKKRYCSIVQTIVPLEVIGNKSTNRAAFSSHLLKGAIFRAVPKKTDKYWKLDLAVDLAHEVGHQALIIYQSADRIVKSDLDKAVYSGVRKVNRPAIMSFHAAAALVYMIEYLNAEVTHTDVEKRLNLDELAYAQSELNTYRRDLADAIHALEKVEFTDVGNAIFQEFTEFSRLNIQLETKKIGSRL